jgi:hypothetical protein
MIEPGQGFPVVAAVFSRGYKEDGIRIRKEIGVCRSLFLRSSFLFWGEDGGGRSHTGF